MAARGHLHRVSVHGPRAHREPRRAARGLGGRAEGRRDRRHHGVLRRRLVRAPDPAAAGRVRRGPRHEGRLQHRHEGPPGGCRAAERRLMAVLVALTVGLVWWITAWAFGVKAFDAFLLTAFLVVCAAAYQLMKPFIDQALGREVAEPEEQGAGF